MPIFFSDANSGGISALGVNLKAFLFQLITFVIVLLILRRWVFPKLVATLEERRKTLEESLVQAKQTEEALTAAEAKADELLHKAREEADAALAESAAQAKKVASEIEQDARAQAERIMAETKQHLSQEKVKLHDELKQELVELVTTATAKVLEAKVDSQTDKRLIEKSIKESF